MKNVNKIKGLTLIEVMVLMSLILGFILIFLNMDMTTNEKQNTRKVGTQLNMIVSAVDKRISIEGKDFSYWKNGSSWTGSQFKDFLRQELVGANNTTCGSPSKGWKPTYDVAGLDESKSEGKNVVNMYNNALSGKLIPCTLWTVYPYDIVPSAKLTATADNKLESVLLTFKFANIADWDKGFAKFNESYSFAKEQKNTTLLTTKSFYYADASQNKINMKQCLTLKNQCSMNLKISIGSSATDDKKFKVDSSNSFENNLGFAKSVKENKQVNCTIWTMDTSINPPKWNPRTTACGVTGGSGSIDKEVSLLGDNIDAQNIKITGKCIDYAANFPLKGTDYNSDCGMLDNGSLVQLNSSILQATTVASDNLVVLDAKINELSVNSNVDEDDNIIKKKSTTKINENLNSLGKSLADTEPAKENLEQSDLESISSTTLFNDDYRQKPAEVSFNAKKIETKDFDSQLESIISNTLNATKLDISNKFLLIQHLVVPQFESGTAYFNYLKSNGVSNITNNLVIAYPENDLNKTTISSQNFNNISSTKHSIVLGDINAKNIQVSKGGTSEQLNFRKSFDSSKIVKVSKSFNFDNLSNKYIKNKDETVKGWGAEGYISNSGVFAKRFYINNDLIVRSTADESNVRVADSNSGTYVDYTGYRNGIELTYDQFPDTRGMFYMNDMGKVLSSGYYATGKTSGIRIGGGFDGSGNGNIDKKGFFWGRHPDILSKEFGDVPLKTNLASSIYGYNAEDDVTAINSGYKMIVKDLTVYAAMGTNLYSGAYYFNGLPKILSGSSITGTDVPINYISAQIGEYWETADGIYLRHLNANISYYLNRISYIYGQYVNLNKLGTIKGSKGDRGSRGQTGSNGIKGEIGSQGIPGPVGNRG
jgi:hypothetical protein